MATKKLPHPKEEAADVLSRIGEVYLKRISSDTVSFLRPLARLRDNTFLPLALAILSLKPCLFLRFLLDG